MAELDPVPKKKATELETTLRRRVAAFLDVDESEVTDDSSFVDDLGADSLDCVEIVMMVEEDYHIDIDADAADRLKKFSDLVKAIEKRQAGPVKAVKAKTPAPEDQSDESEVEESTAPDADDV